MKKILFFLALFAGITASAAVKVTPLNANYSTQEVTFKVEWQNTSVPYNNRVWVWIDFCPVTGTTPATSFSTATVSNPTKTGGNGTITGATARGFFIEYANATNAGTTVTATLSNALAGQFNWCAYGSDYPPNAVTNAGGGYMLRGSKPFTINGALSIDSETFGAGTCIISIADLTGRPDGFAGTPDITAASSPAVCYNTAASLSATIDGGATTAMTYTWTIGSVVSTTTVPNKTTGNLTANTTYTVTARNANDCTSAGTGKGTVTVLNPAVPTLGKTANTCAGSAITFSASGGSGSYGWSCSGFTCSGSGASQKTPTSAGNFTAQVRSVMASGNVTCYSNYSAGQTGTITAPATNGQTANSCDCASGTTNCSGTCKTTGTYTTNDGACTGNCNEAYIVKYDQCGAVVDAKHGTYQNTTCNETCAPVYSDACANDNARVDKCEVTLQEFNALECYTKCPSMCVGFRSYFHYIYLLDGTAYCCCCN